MIYDNSCIDTIICIPDGTTEIADDTGRGNSRVKKVIIPGSVISIRNDVFCDCWNLEEVEFKKNTNTDFKRNGSGIFRDCPNLKDVYFADFKTYEKYTYDTGGPLENGSRLHIAGKQVKHFVIPDRPSGRSQIIRNLRGAIEIDSIAFKDGSRVIGFENCAGGRKRGSINRRIEGITKSGIVEALFKKYPEFERKIEFYELSVDELTSRGYSYENMIDQIIFSCEDFEKEFGEFLN